MLIIKVYFSVLTRTVGSSAFKIWLDIEMQRRIPTRADISGGLRSINKQGISSLFDSLPGPRFGGTLWTRARVSLRALADYILDRLQPVRNLRVLINVRQVGLEIERIRGDDFRCNRFRNAGGQVL